MDYLAGVVMYGYYIGLPIKKVMNMNKLKKSLAI